MRISPKGIPIFIVLFALVSFPSGIYGQTRDPGEEGLDEAGIVLRRTASAAVADRRFADAIIPLRELLDRYPDRYIETQWLAMSYNAEHLYNETIELLSEARKSWPDDYILAEYHGTALLETGSTEEAVRVWHSVLGDEERDVQQYFRVSRLEWAAGMFDRAIATLKEAQRFEKHRGHLSAEIVRMEKIRGNYRAAFMESLSRYDAPLRPDPDISSTIDLFRKAGRPADLIAVVDSMAGSVQDDAFLRSLQAVLLVEVGDFAGMASFLMMAEMGKIPEKDLYLFIRQLFSMKGRAGEEQFEACLERVSSIMINRYRKSQRVAAVLLEGARHAERIAQSGGPGERDAALRAVAMADSVLTHERGGPYAEWALVTKARVQLENLHDPAAALLTIDSIRWRQAETRRRMMDIRLEALMLSGSWEEANRRFDKLAQSPDSVVAASGRYGKGMVLFYGGEFEKAAKELSDMAAAVPWSRWANDALHTAVMIRRAENEDPAVLSAFASAMRGSRSGRRREAADSLYFVVQQFPRSVLAPEALYESALLLGRVGDRGEAVKRLERIAEEYPLSRVAPRAVETLASFLEEEAPQEAVRWYAVFLERYGEDPWATRVRSSYMGLRKSFDESERDGGDL